MKGLSNLHSLPIFSFVGFRLFLLSVLSKFIIKSVTVYVRACVRLSAQDMHVCVCVKATRSSTSGYCFSRPGGLAPQLRLGRYIRYD
jgi:hypothetical protein